MLKAVQGAKKVKEAETLKIANLPDAVGFRAWKIAARNEVAAGSGRDDKGLQWILKVEADGTTLTSSRTPAKSSGPSM